MVVLSLSTATTNVATNPLPLGCADLLERWLSDGCVEFPDP